jgi:D-arabinose 1-dehydrogenase-like Zn-dependent alcohol dehydrogenase
LGCGGLGLHAVQLAKLMGAGLVIALDVSERIHLEDINLGLEALHRKIDNPVRIVVIMDL